MSQQASQPAEADDRPIVKSRSVDIVVLLLLLSLAGLLGWDSARVGNAWADDGPQAGYFPFYLSVLMGAACLWRLVRLLGTSGASAEGFIPALN
jgi:heme A synthase